MSKNILVTGVSQGLGLAIAESIIAEGWNVYGVSRRHSPEYVVLQEKFPGRVHFHAFDLAGVDLVKDDLFGKFLPFSIPLHGYVNNAAMAYDDIVTNLDAGRPVVWDIGAIAASGVPGRKQLIQDILVASSSIPGVFPPVKIKVVADGQTFDEMHVDGGTSNQAFLFPSDFSVRAHDIKQQRSGITRTLYVIRNGKVSPDYQMVKPRLAAIVSRSISTLITTQGVGDLYRMYSNAMRDGIAFRAVWVPDSFTMEEPTPFDPAYMKALYNVGLEMGRNGITWATQPP